MEPTACERTPGLYTAVGMNTRRGFIGCTWVALLLWAVGGCVERNLSVQTDPPGALVYLNDQEIGRTPLQHDFTWYGKYDISLRMDGYKTQRTIAKLHPPLYQIPPFDLIAEMLPFRIVDQQSLSYTMEPELIQEEDPHAVAERGQAYSSQLEASQRPQPATRPK
jgi:PEGA domain-containing protein